MPGFKHIQEDDAEAFRSLYNAYREKVLRYFLKKTNCRSDAEDLLQNTFLNVWKYRESLSEAHSTDQQLFFIARNVFIDYTRRQNKIRKIAGAAGNLPVSYSAPQEAYSEISRLQTLLIQLPEARRKAFILHKMEGYSYKEVAEQLSLSLKSIDNHISRALKQIRKEIYFFVILFFLG